MSPTPGQMRAAQEWKATLAELANVLAAREVALQSQVAALREALTAAEWGGRIGQEGEYRACPSCHNPDPEDMDCGQPEKRKGREDHEADCALAAALADTAAAAQAHDERIRAAELEDAANGLEDDVRSTPEPEHKEWRHGVRHAITVIRAMKGRMG